MLSICLLTELLLRLFVLSPTSTQPDDTLGWRYISNSTIRQSDEGLSSNTLNSLGQNDSELLVSDSHVKRILLLGDSFTESLQIERENNFAELTERESCTEIVNSGQSGMNIMHYPIVVDRMHPYNMDQSVIVLSAGDINDIRHTPHSLTRHPENGEITNIQLIGKPLSFARRLFAPALEHSALLTLLMKRVKLLKLSSGENNTNDSAVAQQQNHSIFINEEDRNAIADIIRFVLKDIQTQMTVAILYLPTYDYLPAGVAVETERSIEARHFLSEIAKRMNIPMATATGFEEFYRKTHRPPVGFANAHISGGHLNQHGHKLVAQSLLTLIGRDCTLSEATP